MPILDTDKEAKKYIRFIKTKKCTSCYTEPVDADHLNTVGMGGIGKEILKGILPVFLYVENATLKDIK